MVARGGYDTKDILFIEIANHMTRAGQAFVRHLSLWVCDGSLITLSHGENHDSWAVIDA